MKKLIYVMLLGVFICSLTIFAKQIEWVTIKAPGIKGHEEFIGQMSKYEITNEQYCNYLNEALKTGDIKIESYIVYGAEGSNKGEDFKGEKYCYFGGMGYSYDGAVRGGASRITFDGTSFVVDNNFKNHPVTYVSWLGAKAFCNYYEYRLPTASEWQAVSESNEVSVIDNKSANYHNSNHPNGTTEVGTYKPNGYGLYDLIGNVSEWTNIYDPNSKHVLTRGGGWEDGNSLLDYYMNPKFTLEYIGFRACKDLIDKNISITKQKNNNNEYWSDYEDANQVVEYYGLRGLDATILKCAVSNYNVNIAQERFETAIETYNNHNKQGQSDEDLKIYTKEAKKWQVVHTEMVNNLTSAINEFAIKPKDNPKQYNEAALRIKNNQRIPQKYRDEIIILEDSHEIELNTQNIPEKEELLEPADVSRSYGLNDLEAMIVEGAVASYNMKYANRMLDIAKANSKAAIGQKNITEARKYKEEAGQWLATLKINAQKYESFALKALNFLKVETQRKQYEETLNKLKNNQIIPQKYKDYLK